MDAIAARHNGTPIHCAHRDAGYCTRCGGKLPTYSAGDSGHTYQFPTADDAVAFCRDAYTSLVR